MGAINVKKFGLAVGLTFAFLHFLCVIVVMLTSRETAIAFFNTLLHGIDVANILRTEMSAREMVYGFVQIFVVGWLTGASIASIYNVSSLKTSSK